MTATHTNGRSIHRILCAVDFSAPSRAALRLAAAVQNDACELIVLHALEPGAGGKEPPGLAYGDGPVPLVDDASLRAADRSMRALARDAGVPWPRVTTSVVRRGRAPEVICDHARELRCDLIVMGTHGGRKGLGQLLPRGSVAEKVFRNAPCPVLIVPERRESRGDTAGEEA